MNLCDEFWSNLDPTVSTSVSLTVLKRICWLSYRASKKLWLEERRLRFREGKWKRLEKTTYNLINKNCVICSMNSSRKLFSWLVNPWIQQFKNYFDLNLNILFPEEPFHCHLNHLSSSDHGKVYYNFSSTDSIWNSKTGQTFSTSCFGSPGRQSILAIV